MSFISPLRIKIEPNWEEIDGVREKSSSYLKDQNLSRDTIDAVTMVACELTENAVKYGHFDELHRLVEIELEFVDDRIIVGVKNHITEDDAEHLERLDRIIQWIRGYQDPFQAYLERLKEVSPQNTDNRDSGLGLVRIAYEGQSILDFFVDEKNIVSVSAIYSIEGRDRKEN